MMAVNLFRMDGDDLEDEIRQLFDKAKSEDDDFDMAPKGKTTEKETGESATG